MTPSDPLKPLSGEDGTYRVEVYKDKKGEFRFRFRASNGEAMFASERYSGKASAMKAIASIKEHVGAAETADLSAAVKTPAKVAAAEKPKAAKAKAAAKAPKAKADA